MPLVALHGAQLLGRQLATAFIYGALALNGFALGGVPAARGRPDLPATLAGLASLPITVLMVLFSSRVGALAGRLGPRLFMTVGPGAHGHRCAAVPDRQRGLQLLVAGAARGRCSSASASPSPSSPLTSAILGAIETGAVGHRIRRQQRGVARRRTHRDRDDRVHRRRRLVTLDGFHRVAIVTAVLMIAGGLVSLAGIRNPAREGGDARPSRSRVPRLPEVNARNPAPGSGRADGGAQQHLHPGLGAHLDLRDVAQLQRRIGTDVHGASGGRGPGREGVSAPSRSTTHSAYDDRCSTRHRARARRGGSCSPCRSACPTRRWSGRCWLRRGRPRRWG